MSIYQKLERRKRGWMPFKVVDIVDDTHDTRTLFLADAESGKVEFDYIAGQYLTFRFDGIKEAPLVRSYTLSSSPIESEHIAFTVKKVDDGIISHWLCNQVKVGDRLVGRGPMGRFCYDHENDPPHLYMVAGGSGVTPFLSILREYANRLGSEGAPQSMHLLVSHRSDRDLIGQPLIDSLAGIKGVEVITTLTRQVPAPEMQNFWHGHINAEKLARFIGDDLSGKVFMTCGPQAIMDCMVNYLKERDAAPEQIKQESFFSS